MRRYILRIKTSASLDIRSIVDFITSINTEKSGLNYATKLIHSLKQLCNCAGAIQFTRYRTAREIHPEAKMISIMRHRWTVVFHIDGDYVVVDRILPSSRMAE